MDSKSPKRRGRRGVKKMPSESGIQRTEVVVVACHPDDAELGAGGPIRLLVGRGYRVIVIYLTRGEKGGDPHVRSKESLRACRRLGVHAADVHFGPFGDTEVPDDHRTIRYLEGFHNSCVAMAFVPSVHEKHQDHRHAALAAETALRRVPCLLAYESPSTTAAFMPTAFVDISGHLGYKSRALRCHESQLAKCMSLEYQSMEHLAAFRGHQAGVRYAEAFETLRFLVGVRVA